MSRKTTKPADPTTSGNPSPRRAGNSEDRTCILVLGMHRSGTSALARTLSLLGVGLPQNIVGADPTNPTGHWEPQRLMQLHDRMLADAGSRWDDWRPFNLEALGTNQLTSYRNEIKQIILEEFGNSALFVIKDPRICRFVPLYEAVLAELDISPVHVLPTRNPLSVIASLEKRDAMTMDFASFLWLRHVLDAESATRRGKRFLIAYEDFLHDWRSVIRELGKHLRLTWPRPLDEADVEIDAFLTPDLEHHAATRARLRSSRQIQGWIRDAYPALCTLSMSSGSDRSALTVLDRIKNEFDKAAVVFGKATFPELSAREDRLTRLRQQQADQMARTETSKLELERSIGSLETQLSTLRESLSTVQRERNSFAEENVELARRLALQAKTFAEQTRSLASLQEAHAGRTVELGVARQEIASLTQLAAQRDALSNELGDVKQELTALKEALALAESEREALAGDLEGKEKSLSAETMRAASLMDQNHRLSESYNGLHGELRRERLQVLKPLYRNLYRGTGQLARRVLPSSLVETIKRKVPHPDAAHISLSHQPQFGDSTRIDLADIEPAGSKADVFVFSIINWNFRYQRPQHLASVLAASGRRVFYIEMELADAGIQIVRKGECLYSVRLNGGAVGPIQPYSGQVDLDQAAAWVRSFYELCESVGVTSCKTVIIEHPFWWQLAAHLPPDFGIVFDCMDDIAGFSNTEPFILDLETKIINACDRLIVSSQYLYDKYKGLKTPYLVRNGGDIEHFELASEPRPLPEFMSARGFDGQSDRIRVGYVGAIAEWFDTELLEQVAIQMPDAEFHLCGAVTAKKPGTLATIENITMYGEVPYSDVPAFLERMDVLLIPFQLLPIIQACDPVKFYEYSAMGKPTVSTRLPELERASHLVFFASSATEFIDQISNAAAMGKDRAFQRKLRDYASENTWTKRGQQMIQAIESFPKVSVIVLSYGDPELTKGTIHSLVANGGNYPNLEVLVVDNGSPREALIAIRNYAAQFPTVRLIENGENLGFARGNNVGLNAASGQYVMLLNNDTFVAPGSIAAMASHLERNPSLGAVGPLTNNIGNEARIPVNYADMEEMRRVARDLTTGYRGKLTPIRVVAHFAVMFRRADLDRFGLLPEDYGRGMFEDDHHCATIRSQGYICGLAEDAFIHHHLSATFGALPTEERSALFERNKAIFERKWGKWIPHQYRDHRPASSLTR